MTVRPILIVDDDIDHAVILRTVLASVAPDAPTETCTDVSRLPEVIIEAAPDAVVFMDRMLRGVDSLRYLKAVCAARTDLHVVVLSGALSREDRQRACDAGAADAFEKPGSLAEWRALLSQVLGDADRRSDGRDSARTG